MPWTQWREHFSPEQTSMEPWSRPRPLVGERIARPFSLPFSRDPKTQSRHLVHCMGACEQHASSMRAFDG